MKDREKSIREESVDGGYLVTMGVYVGPEDYSKEVVRQIQVRCSHSSESPCTTPYGVPGPRSLLRTQY